MNLNPSIQSNILNATLKNCSVLEYDGYIEYRCTDSYNNTYIFKEKYPMNYILTR